MMYYQYVYFFTPYNMNAKTLASLLRAQDLNGFTKLIHGQRLERYVIAFTHCGDEKGDIEKIATKLTATIECLPKNINLTVGGWKDAKTGKLYIDL